MMEQGGPGMMSFLKRNMERAPLVIFYLLTLLISWSCWLLGSGIDSQVFLILGSFGPAIAAMIIAASTGGKKEMRKILKRFGIWRVGLRWYLFSLLITIPVIGGALLLRGGANGIEAVNTGIPFQMIPIVFAYVFFFSVIGEEIGWRGFALPRLLKRFGEIRTSLVLGLAWGFWHLPLFILPGNFHQWIPFSWFMVQSIGLTWLITYLYRKTEGSLLIISLFHTASNVTIGLMPVLPTVTNPDPSMLITSICMLYVLIVILGFTERTKA